MIRFKKDDGSNYPERKEITFDELAEYKKGPFGSALKKEIFVPKSQGTVKVYEQQNAIGHDWKLERYFITKDYFEKMKSFEIHAGDIIVSCAGTIGEMYILPENAEKGVINQALMRVRENKEIVNQNYFMMIFDQMLSNEGKKLSNGSALKNIPPFADLKKQKVLLPCLEEQQKIADFLSSVDDVITASEQEVAALEEQKKGVMQKIFSQEVRFKDDNGNDYPEWEENILENITSRCIVGLATSVTPYYRESGVPILRNLNIKENYLDDSDLLFLDKDYASQQENKMIHTGDVITVHTGYIGISCLVPEKYNNCLTFTTLVTTVKEDILYNKYLVQFLNSSIGIKRIMGLTTTGGRNNLNTKDFIMLSVPCPCLEEQKKIADFLSDMDTAIDIAKQELEQWKELKKGLLQQLFE